MKNIVILLSLGLTGCMSDAIGHIEKGAVQVTPATNFQRDSIGHVENGAVVVEAGALTLNTELNIPETVLAPIGEGIKYSADVGKHIGEYAVDAGIKTVEDKFIPELQVLSDNADKRFGQFLPPIWLAMLLGVVGFAVLVAVVVWGIKRGIRAYEKDKASELKVQAQQLSNLIHEKPKF